MNRKNGRVVEPLLMQFGVAPIAPLIKQRTMARERIAKSRQAITRFYPFWISTDFVNKKNKNDK